MTLFWKFCSPIKTAMLRSFLSLLFSASVEVVTGGMLSMLMRHFFKIYNSIKHGLILLNIHDNGSIWTH